MGDLTHRVTSMVLNSPDTPSSTISIKVNRLALRSVVQQGLKKTNWIERNIPFSLRNWVNVEAAEHGTDDSVFFVPERPNVDQSHERTLPAQYIKIDPTEHDDVVRRGDDFEVSFVGMSVAPMDIVGNNEILLVSLTREENSTLEAETKWEDFMSPSSVSLSDRDEVPDTEQDKSLAANAQAMMFESFGFKPQEGSGPASTAGKATGADVNTEKTEEKKLSAVSSATVESGVDDGRAVNETSLATESTDSAINKDKKPAVDVTKQRESKLLSELPTALTIQPGDIPFLHYDPEIDGHDTGSAPNAFVPIPGSKRVYLQRRGEESGNNDVSLRFTVMEVDKLSEEQLIAIKSLDDIGKSVGKAAATVPYLKFISWILKFANFLGRSALKKVAEPEHVLSKDMVFLLADPVDNASGPSGNRDTSENSLGTSTRREQYGNYLRYGYYFFLNTTVDAKLYAQTGSSSQNVPLLLRRSGYKARFAMKNEREFFPLTGVSYVAVKVSRGCSPLNPEQRAQMKERHRVRLVTLLKKYTGKLENAVA